MECLPDDPFNDSSFLPADVPPQRPTPELSAAEKGRLNKAAKMLIMADNRKATAVVDYVKAILARELIPPPPDPAPQDMNCAFRAVLAQMPNHEYFFNPETGEVYSAMDLRNQFVSFCVENAQDLFVKLKATLDKPFKQWLLLQLDPLQESDHSTILGLRHMLKVIIFFLKFNFSAGLGTEDWANIDEDRDAFIKDWNKLLKIALCAIAFLKIEYRLLKIHSRSCFSYGFWYQRLPLYC